VRAFRRTWTAFSWPIRTTRRVLIINKNIHFDRFHYSIAKILSDIDFVRLKSRFLPLRDVRFTECFVVRSTVRKTIPSDAFNGQRRRRNNRSWTDLKWYGRCSQNELSTVLLSGGRVSYLFSIVLPRTWKNASNNVCDLPAERIFFKKKCSQTENDRTCIVNPTRSSLRSESKQCK